MLKLSLFLLMFFLTSAILHQYCSIKIQKKKELINESGILSVDFSTVLFTFLLSLIPVIIIALRGIEVGADTNQYNVIFSYGENYVFEKLNHSSELLFWGLFWISQRYFSIQFAFFVLALLSIWFPMIAIYKFSNLANAFIMTFSYYCVFYHECFNIIRQTPALGLIMLGMCYVYQRNPIKYFVVIILAMAFHSSAIFALPIYFLYKIKKVNIGLFFRRIIILVLGVAFFSRLLTITINVFGFSNYQQYVESDSMVGYGWLKSLIILIPIYVVLLFIQNNRKKYFSSQDNTFDIQFLWFLSFIYIAILATRMYTNWVYRLGYYYQIGSILLAGRLCKDRQLSDSWIKYRYSASSVLALMVFLYWNIYINYIVNHNNSPLIFYSIS